MCTKRGVVECRKYSEVRLNKLMSSSSSAIQKPPRTQSIMKPKINRLFLVDRVSGSSQDTEVATYKNEVTPDVCGTLDKGLIGRVEVPDVASLHDKHDDPIDAGHDGIEGKWSSHVPVLAPNGVASVIMFAVHWNIEGVVNCYDDNKEP